jgi:hypothetical protein
LTVGYALNVDLASKTGVQMDLGFIASLVLATLAIIGVFVEIPIVSDHAFWVMAGAYLVIAGTATENARKLRKKK